MSENRDTYDFFLSHATEDKNNFVRPLAHALIKFGFSVWYDEISLRAGNSIFEGINSGLLNSRIGVVVLSKNFMAKNWAKSELSAIFSLKLSEKSMIIPVWHQITKDDVAESYPLLLDLVSINGNAGPFSVAQELSRALCAAYAGSDSLNKYRKKIENKDGNREFLEELFAFRAEFNGGKKSAFLCVVDIDDMTKINKVYGENVGDNVILMSELILADRFSGFKSVVGRCGDDTFFVALYASYESSAFDAFKSICGYIKDYDWNSEANGLRVTCSVGYAGFSYQEESGLDLAIRASIGMRNSKEKGGNRAELGPGRLPHIFSRNLYEYFS